MIEQAWGMVVNRFRIFKAVSEISSKDWYTRFTKVIIAGIIIHNICLHMKEKYAQRETFDRDNEDESSSEFRKNGVKKWYLNDPAIIGLKEKHSIEELETAAAGTPPVDTDNMLPQDLVALWAHKTYNYSESNHGLYAHNETSYNLLLYQALHQSQADRHQHQAAAFRRDHPMISF